MISPLDFVSRFPVGTALLVQSIYCGYPHSYPLCADKIKARRHIVRLASLLLQNYRHYSSMYSTSFGSPLIKYPSSVLYIGFPSTFITCVTIFSVNAVAPLTASLLHEGAFLILMLPLNTLLIFPLILTAARRQCFL